MTEITKRFNKLCGRTFLYNGSQIKINNFTAKEDYYVVDSDKKGFKVAKGDADQFLNDLQEVTLPVVQDSFTLQQAKQGVETVSSLKDIIMANIQKVQSDANYIPQADAINNQVKTYIDLTKTQLEFLKFASK